MAAIEIEIKGLKELQAAFQKSPQIVKGELDPAIRTVITLLDKEARIETPVDTGLLRRSHSQVLSVLKGVLRNELVYAWPVHEKVNPFYDIAVSRSEGDAMKIFEKALDNITNKLSK